MFYILLCTGRLSSRYWGRQWKSTHKGMSLHERKGITNYSNNFHDFELYEFMSLVKLLRVWRFWVCWFSSWGFFSPIISLNTSCRVEIGWYSPYRAIRWTVFVWKWNLRTKSCHFPWCWRTRRNTRLILHERLLQSYYAIHQFHLWNHQNAWITNCNSIFHFL